MRIIRNTLTFYYFLYNLIKRSFQNTYSQKEDIMSTPEEENLLNNFLKDNAGEIRAECIGNNDFCKLGSERACLYSDGKEFFLTTDIFMGHRFKTRVSISIETVKLIDENVIEFIGIHKDGSWAKLRVTKNTD